MTNTKLVLSQEDMARLWELYRSGASWVSIQHTFGIKEQQARRLCREAATTIGAAEALAKLNGDNDAAT